MSKQLVFTVTDEPPTTPGQAYWDGYHWQIMDWGNMIWTIHGPEDAATEPKDRGGIDPYDLEKLLAVALHRDAAVASITGEGA